MDNHVPAPHYWFHAKRYGYGWRPSTWQGWVVLAVWAVVFIALVLGCVAAAAAMRPVVFGVLLALSFASTIAMLWIAYRHGEPAHWRWGRPE